MLSRTLNGASKIAIGVALLSMISVLCAGDIRCQTPASPPINPRELHGGIEIALQAVRAIVLRVSSNGENLGIQDTDQIIPSTPFPRDEKLNPEYIRDLAEKAQKLSETLLRDFGVPPDQIYLLGLSEIAGQIRDELARELRSRIKIGREITFLDAKSETELNIAGNIPRRYPYDGKWYENRNISFLLDIGSTNVKGGYQKLRLTTSGRAEYDYVTWDIPIKGPLRAEAAQNPDLMTRKKVYLTGNIVWALATLLYPQDQEPYKEIAIEDINKFYSRATIDPEALLNPDLSRIRDENVRNEARKGREAIKAIYTTKSLAAGAENLKIAVTELSLSEKRLIFSRNSNFARLLSFVRLQIE